MKTREISYPLPDALVLGQGDDSLHVLVSQGTHRHLVVFLSDVVGLDDRREDGEAICCVQGSVVVIVVHSSQLLQES